MKPYPRYRNQSFENPLMQAAAEGDLARLRERVEAGEALDQISENGSVPLGAAVRGQHRDRLAVIQWLLETGAPVDHADVDSNSPLHLACYLGDLEAAELLLEHGADLGLDNDDHLAPLAAASSAGNWPLAESLIRHGAALNPSHGIPPLHATAMLGRDDPLGAEILIAAGAETNFRGKLGRTALMGAAMKGNPLIAELLLKSSADINARDDFGNTALMEAARSGANQVLERFTFWHPDTGYRDKPGRTALLVAVSSRRADPETIRLLLAMGADPHVRNREGREAGDLASAAGRWRVAKALGYEPVLGRSTEAGALTATQALSRIENEDEPLLIDIADFQTKADSEWAKRQLLRRSRTQLDAATPVLAAATARPETVTGVPASDQGPALRVAADPDWPEPGETADPDRQADVSEHAPGARRDFEAAPQFELIPQDLPVPTTGAATPREATEPGSGAAEPETVTADLGVGTATPEIRAAEPATDAPAAGADDGAEAAQDHAVAPAPDVRAMDAIGADPEEPGVTADAQQGPSAADDPEAGLDSVVELEAPDHEALDSEQPGVFSDASPAASEDRQVGYNALLEAATSDDIDQMKVVMLSQDEVPEWWLAAAFLNAVACGSIVAPRWLLDNGLSANASSEGGQALLSCVVQQSPTPVDIIALLLDRGARATPDAQHLLWISGYADHQHQSEEELGTELEEQLAALVPRLIGSGALPEPRDPLGRSPLHWAIRYRGIKYLDALLEAGCEVDALDEGGNSALMYAVETSRSTQMAMARALIKHGADPRRGNAEGVSAISCAMDAGDNTLLKLLMLGKSPETPAAAPAGREDLIGAAAEGNLGRVKRLLAQRIDVNTRDAGGCTALLRAAGGGHSNIVTTLLAAGADLGLGADNHTTPLGAAVLGNHLEVVRLLVERGAPVDQAQQFGITPLMLAAACWHPKMARLLLKLGAQVDQRDEADGTALMAAAQNAMYSSHLSKGEDTLKVLLAAGADVNAVNDEGQSVLMLLMGVRARESQSAEGPSLVRLVRQLMEAGADLDAQDFTGWCALHAAAVHGFLEPAQALLAAGASKRLRDINGLSPCDLAMDHAHDRLVDLFLAS